MTQMQLAVQGASVDTSGADFATFFRLEDTKHSVESLKKSRFLAAIGAEHVPIDMLTSCLGQVETSAHNHGRIQGFEALPQSEELYVALQSEQALMLSLCQVYAQDSLCLSAQYELPPICRELFEW